jgi:excisionase family DNA binding protein
MPQDMSNINIPAVLTVAEVAHTLRVSKMTIYRLIESGDLSAIRVGRSFRIPARAVEDFISARYGQKEPQFVGESTTPRA